MKTVRQHFPWMTAAEEPVLRTELLRRAAVGFEQAGQLSDAAECWRDAGEPIRASEMHVRNGDQSMTVLFSRRPANGSMNGAQKELS